MKDVIAARMTRQSNMELLRIVAMLFVLIVHADFLSLGEPTKEFIQSSPLFAFWQYVVESFTIVSVNVFILISGWFGIKPKVKSFSSFIFQCIFLLLVANALSVMLGASFSGKVLTEDLFFGGGLWFVHSYIGLYVMSPVLNAFLEKATSKQVLMTLTCFYLFQTYFGWTGHTDYIVGGYCPWSFMGLYVLARWLRLYAAQYMNISKWGYFRIYLLTSLFIAVVSFLDTKYKLPVSRMFNYSSPFVVISSAALLMFFSKLQFNSRWVNRVAASCFAVYLLHNHSVVIDFFTTAVRGINDHYNGIGFILILSAFLIAVYVLSILIDQVRIWVWSAISKVVFKEK